MDVADGATGNTTGTRLQCSNGQVVALVSGSACTFVTGNGCSPLATTCAVSCIVNKWYDQSGQTNCTTACDARKSTTTAPAVTLNCQNGLICVTYNGATPTCLASPSVSAATVNQPLTVSIVSQRTG